MQTVNSDNSGKIIVKQFFLAALYALIIVCSIFDTGKTLADDIAIPNYWSPNQFTSKPKIDKNNNIKFIVTTDFRPFSFIDEEKNIKGFHGDLARAICAELDMQNKCLIQAVPWRGHEIARDINRNTVLLSGLASSKATRRRLFFTRPYLVIPARFVAQRHRAYSEPIYQELEGKVVAVIASTAHATYISENLKGSKIKLFQDNQSLFEALKNESVDAIFSDALTISNWLHSGNSEDCCQFVGGPYISQKYFGYGFSIAVPQDNRKLLQSLNYALRAINQNGKFAEVFLRYFPIGLF